MLFNPENLIHNQNVPSPVKPAGPNNQTPPPVGHR